MMGLPWNVAKRRRRAARTQNICSNESRTNEVVVFDQYCKFYFLNWLGISPIHIVYPTSNLTHFINCDNDKYGKPSSISILLLLLSFILFKFGLINLNIILQMNPFVSFTFHMVICSPTDSHSPLVVAFPGSILFRYTQGASTQLFFTQNQPL